ncbi:uncharacterized protein BDR25DRAFT_231059 [Lindgomyces ingoldianus]|uniref:Uncharacterized protein n=1 Tax=Lindgomyces ingoldianus TaxID=673940 RepID=A0ACB6QNE1_9PLEO|nr:uncharacterized protein BDR25DRAFT_231059 [Lindgomyces ingoldianus]KAF2468524.1 hypothetical protein BDR25DRAFT_231059 [Lindgomyces ingoldianus]
METLSFKPTPKGATKFETSHPPERMGNTANIAYGGFALAVAVKGAYLTLPESPTYYLYSMLGNYLGPALTDRPLRCSIKNLRQTRTFATRLVEVSQISDNQEERSCLVALADFQVQGEALLTYYAPPSRIYSSHANLPENNVLRAEMVSSGKIPQSLATSFEKSFSVMNRLYETRPCPEGVFAQTLSGMAKSLPTTQDGLPLTSKSTADWVRSRHALTSPEDQLANLAFIMDGALSFVPLSFAGMWLDDSSACSSLDFALRVFGNSMEIDMREWWLRELKSYVGAEGRTYSEGRLFDEGGRCVASMTQQSILRPLSGKGKL